ncbi:hypothetical protein OYT88_11960 [Sporolactobacillus sp. CQH2019]|uniref:hypothetical protein n=1 Tax=Sporolactobacillus sp. CQH2019 TaxID=3023512 RepID=UPI002367631B|nr:hypothetical protein [Sporolactobacillus sp. CQH2019]MDD9149269.1 hypothetical protein [Sporolactobacillus sp. CQH2019]
MFQTIISSGLTDLIKLVALAAGSFLTVFIKHHADLAKLSKVEAFLSSKSAAAELTKKVANEVSQVLESPATVDKGSEVIAAFAQKKGIKVTQDEVKALLSELQSEGKQVANEVKAAASGTVTVQSPASPVQKA